MDAKVIYYYHPGLFTDRLMEVDRVKELVRKLQAGREEAEERAIIFTGVRGAGKTWLSLYLSRSVYEEGAEIQPFLISLLPVEISKETKDWEWWPEREDEVKLERELLPYIREILGRLGKILRIDLHPEDEAGEQSRQLALGLTRSPQAPVLLLIVDSAFESPREALRSLQQYVLTPLLHTGRAAAVVAGRGKFHDQPGWDSPYLRDAEVYSLPNLAAEDVLSIIKSCSGRHKDRVQDILEFSGGYPLVARLLAESQQATFQESVEEAIDMLLDIAKEPRLRQEIKDYVLRAAALEHAFRDEYIQALLTEEGTAPIAISQVRRLRGLLQSHNLMEWDIPESGYEVNEPLPNLSAQYLKRYQPERWKSYRERSRDYFLKLAKDYHNDQEARQYFTRLAERYSPMEA